MPQIGWLEILVIVVLIILIVGPKDLPIVIKKVTGWMNSFRGYFNDFKNEITEVEKSIEDEISFDKDLSDDENKKN
jgi:sec-independent protein translocase protein TatB